MCGYPINELDNMITSSLLRSCGPGEGYWFQCAKRKRWHCKTGAERFCTELYNKYITLSIYHRCCQDGYAGVLKLSMFNPSREEKRELMNIGHVSVHRTVSGFMKTCTTSATSTQPGPRIVVTLK